jgi:putative oxidoreductase
MTTEHLRISPRHADVRGADVRTSADARPAVSTADIALLLLRLTFGLLMAGHGAQKLFGLFGGPGLSATGKSFAALGYRPGDFYAGLTGVSELLGGLGLALGLVTPLAAAAVIGVMINALVLHSPNGLYSPRGDGMEYPLLITIVALTIAAIGPGRLALDRVFPWRNGGLVAATVALGLGGAAAAIVLYL